MLLLRYIMYVQPLSYPSFFFRVPCLHAAVYVAFYLCACAPDLFQSGLSAVVFGFPVDIFGGRRPAAAMVGHHTVTVFVPKLASAQLALFYRYLTKSVDRHEPVETPLGLAPAAGAMPVDDYPHWNTIMFCSTRHDHLFHVWVMRGRHLEQLTKHSTATGYHWLGYMDIHAVVKLYWHIFQQGHYLEVFAYAQDLPPCLSSYPLSSLSLMLSSFVDVFPVVGLAAGPRLCGLFVCPYPFDILTRVCCDSVPNSHQ